MTLKMSTYHVTVRKRLKKLAKPSVKEGYENYFKKVTIFHGVKTLGVKRVMKETLPLLSDKSIESIVKEAFSLLESDYSEEKQIGVGLLSRQVKKLPENFLRMLEPVFERGVYDWATCDGIAGRVLRPLLKKDKKTLSHIVSWSLSKNIWRKRASAVAFVNEARHGDYNNEIMLVCSRLAGHPERFVQLGMGWVLRELFLADQEAVLKFLRKNYEGISREGLRYALEKMPDPLKKKILQEHKEELM